MRMREDAPGCVRMHRSVSIARIVETIFFRWEVLGFFGKCPTPQSAQLHAARGQIFKEQTAEADGKNIRLY